MTESTFSVRIADLEVGPQHLAGPISLPWLEHALLETEARPRDAGRLDLELTLNGKDVMVRGTLHVLLTMPCSVTLDPVDVNIDTEVFLLLTRKEIPRTVPKRLRADAAAKAGAKAGAKAEGAKADGAKVHAPAKGFASQVAKKRGGHDHDTSLAGWSEDPSLADSEAATDTYEGDVVRLDPFLREFLLLELPINPKRSDLRSDEDVAKALRSAGLETATEPHLDPRLAPLAALASRLRQNKE